MLFFHLYQKGRHRGIPYSADIGTGIHRYRYQSQHALSGNRIWQGLPQGIVDMGTNGEDHFHCTSGFQRLVDRRSRQDAYLEKK